MRHLLAIAAGAALVAAPVVAAEPGGAAAKQRDRTAAPALRLVVPAYFYPAGEGLRHWDRLLAAADRVPITAIVNPASGPGKAADPNYVKLLERAGKTKITLLGYVSTSYAKRPLADVKADIDVWLRLYSGLQGVFLDEQASSAEHLDYYAALRDHARSKPGLKLVVSNPGTVCDERYLSRPAADIACLFEGPKAPDPSALPDWIGKHSPDRVLVLSYKVATADAMRKCIAAAGKKVGCIYITDADGANPWDRLPSYWDEEVAAVREANEGKQQQRKRNANKR